LALPSTDPTDALPGPGALARPAAWVVNGLTGGRFVLALAFPFAPAGWRLPLVLAGGLSDWVDGWVSRKAGVVSLFGQIVDPIADKLLVASVLFTLWADGAVATWQLPLVGFRDIAVAAASAYALAARGRGELASMPPNRLGKLATAAQFLYLLAVLYDEKAARIAFALATPLSVAAGFSYLRRGMSRPPGVGPNDRR